MEFHVEGMDCTGKSAAIDELENVASFERRHRILTSDNPFVAPFREKQKFYAWNSEEVTSELIHAIKYDIENYLSSENNLVQESTLITKGFAMRIVDGISQKLHAEFEDLMDAYPKFDESVYFIVDDDVRLARFNDRLRNGGRITANDYLIVDDFDRFKRIDRVMLSLAKTAFGAYTIDTSRMTPSEIATEINPFNGPRES